MSYPQVKFDDWLKAWKSWAVTRKRGKMAQFIVNKLEENKQAIWLDISKGKFQLTEWHTIAEEWFRQKPRSSDQVDAPCMLRKGLPRAFPGLEEVKTESIKEGTQYRSRVFQAPQTLLAEVRLYINKPVYNTSQQNGYYDMYASSAQQSPLLSNGPTTASFSSMPYTAQHFLPVVSSSNPPVTIDGGHMTQGGGHMTQGGDPYLSPPIKLEDQVDVLGSPASSDTAQSPYYYSNGYNQSAFLPGVDTIGGDGSPYNGSPYSHEGPSPVSGGFPISTATGTGGMLQVPPSDSDTWSAAGSMANSSYSPEPGGYQAAVPGQPPISPHSGQVDVATGLSLPQHSPIPALLQVQPFPNQSLLEGGGQLALLFSGELPAGSKWLSFNSQTRQTYVHQVEAVQGNDAMALTAIIPKHDMPETVTLQVINNGQLVAQTEFTYYANAQYNSDMLFHYLAQSFPSYFPDVTMGGNMDLDQGDGSGGAEGGYYYSNNIPPTSYSLLLGACRLGIEQLVYATLELKSMETINSKQLKKAHHLADESGHAKLAEVLERLADVSLLCGKGEEGSKVTPMQTDEGKKAIETLEKASDAKECAGKVLTRLSSIARMERRSKVEEEREQSSDTVTTPTEADEPVTRRRSSSNRLQRQEKPIREEEDLLPVPSTDTHSRRSIAEVDDTVAPLSSRPRMGGSVRGRGRRMLIATHSDAADSAVSMSFDGDSSEYFAEVARRNSARDASLGLFQFNRQQECISVTINPETGYTLANSLQYECSYQVTDDYPPNSDPSNVIFRTGDKIMQIGDTSLRDKGPDDFALLLQTEACQGTSIRIIPRLSPPPNMSLSLGYGSLDVGDKSVLSRRQSEQQLMSSLTLKVSNLLSMKAPGPKRIVTLPRSGDGFGFKLTGGNAVGLFVSEVQSGRDEVKIGDQVLEIGGETTLEMTMYGALELLKRSKDKVQLKVMENNSKFQSILLQFEYDSFYVRTHIDHTPSDSKDMTLMDGGFARVVNCTLDPNYWLAWSVDMATGADMILRKIPSPHKAHSQFGKHIYETVPLSEIQDQISA